MPLHVRDGCRPRAQTLIGRQQVNFVPKHRHVFNRPGNPAGKLKTGSYIADKTPPADAKAPARAPSGNMIHKVARTIQNDCPVSQRILPGKIA
jgi:hypothetical protein